MLSNFFSWIWLKMSNLQITIMYYLIHPTRHHSKDAHIFSSTDASSDYEDCMNPLFFKSWLFLYFHWTATRFFGAAACLSALARSRVRSWSSSSKSLSLRASCEAMRLRYFSPAPTDSMASSHSTRSSISLTTAGNKVPVFKYRKHECPNSGKRSRNTFLQKTEKN